LPTEMIDIILVCETYLYPHASITESNYLDFRGH